MHEQSRVRLIRCSALSLILLVVGGIIWLLVTDNPWRDQEAAGQRIGDVRLELNMTYSELRQRLGADYDYMKPYTNATTLYWNKKGRVVHATFWVDSPEKIQDGLPFVELEVEPTFKGTFCGVRPGTSIQEARKTIEERYRDVRAEKTNAPIDRPSYFQRGKKLNCRWEFKIGTTKRIIVEGIDDRVERIESETQGIGARFY